MREKNIEISMIRKKKINDIAKPGLGKALHFFDSIEDFFLSKSKPNLARTTKRKESFEKWVNKKKGKKMILRFIIETKSIKVEFL